MGAMKTNPLRAARGAGPAVVRACGRSAARSTTACRFASACTSTSATSRNEHAVHFARGPVRDARGSRIRSRSIAKVSLSSGIAARSQVRAISRRSGCIITPKCRRWSKVLTGARDVLPQRTGPCRGSATAPRSKAPRSPRASPTSTTRSNGHTDSEPREDLGEGVTGAVSSVRDLPNLRATSSRRRTTPSHFATAARSRTTTRWSSTSRSVPKTCLATRSSPAVSQAQRCARVVLLLEPHARRGHRFRGVRFGCAQ